MRRVNLREILRDPVRRRNLFVDVIIATQAREGIVTTREQAEAAYDEVCSYDADLCLECCDGPVLCSCSCHRREG